MNTCGSICNRSWRIWLPGAVICLVLAACAPGPRGDDHRHRDNRPDPLGHSGDETIVTGTDIGLPDHSRLPADSAGSRKRSKNASLGDGSGQGYDVQFFASLNIQEAREIQRQTDTLTTMPVRVVYEEPYYKVLAGPYPTFDEADELLKAVQRMGFSSAWIVAHRVKAED